MAMKKEEKGFEDRVFECGGRHLIARQRKIFSFSTPNQVGFFWTDGEARMPVEADADDEKAAADALRAVGIDPGKEPELLKELAIRRKVAKECGPEAAGLLLRARPDAIPGMRTYLVSSGLFLGHTAKYLIHRIPNAGVYYPQYGFVQKPAAIDAEFHIPADQQVLSEIAGRLERLGGVLRVELLSPEGPEIAAAWDAVGRLKELLALPPREQLARWAEIEGAASIIYPLLGALGNTVREMIRRGEPPERVAMVQRLLSDAKLLGVSPERLAIRRELLSALPPEGAWREEVVASLGEGKLLVRIGGFVLIRLLDGELRFPEAADFRKTEDESERAALLAAVDQNLETIKMTRDAIADILRRIRP